VSHSMDAVLSEHKLVIIKPMLTHQV